MTHDPHITCSLGAGDLQARLAEIASVGADSLIDREVDGDHRQHLRFRADARTNERLQAIVAAESLCCPFLDIELTTHAEELRLTISAPEDARPVADDLALAFGPHHPGDGVPVDNPSTA